MINETSIQAVDRAKFSNEFCKPLYGSYSFYQIPYILEYLFSGISPKQFPQDLLGNFQGPIDQVVVILLDAFGWRFFEKYKHQIPELQTIEKNWVVSKMTSMFPSTTTAHMSCLHSGLDASQTGLYEWFILEPFLNEIIVPLIFSFAGDFKLASLETVSFPPEKIFFQKNLYQDFKKKGIHTHAIQPGMITSSPFSKHFLKGAEIHNYDAVEKAIDTIISLAKQPSQKQYLYFYYSDIDSMGHRHGPLSPPFTEAIEKVFIHLRRLFEHLKNTAVIITADHGMIEVDPKNTYYLNKKIPNIEKYFLLNARGKPLTPAGSCRDFFLHLRKESFNECIEILRHFLHGIADVYPTEDLINRNFFGIDPPSDDFLKRVGNAVILPYPKEAVWWYEKKHFQQNYYGAHGGLTPEEMEIPFLFTVFD